MRIVRSVLLVLGVLLFVLLSHVWHAADPTAQIVAPPAPFLRVATRDLLPETCTAGQSLAVTTGSPETECGIYRCNGTGDGWLCAAGGQSQSASTGLVTSSTAILAQTRQVTTMAAAAATLGQHSILALEPPATGQTITVPDAATAPAGEYLLLITNTSNGVVTIQPTGTNTLSFATGPVTLQGRNSLAQLVRTSETNWDVERRSSVITGAVDFSSAASLRLPVQPSPTVTAAGDCRFDSTKKTVVCGHGTGTMAHSFSRAIQFAGSANNSGSGAGTEITHTPSYQFEANYLTLGKKVSMCAQFALSTGATAPAITIRFRLGGTNLGPNSSVTPTNNLTNRGWVQCYDWVVAEAPSASSDIYAGLRSVPTAMNSVAIANGSTAQPQAFNTTTALTADITSEWASAGTGTNVLTLQWLSMEVTN